MSVTRDEQRLRSSLTLAGLLVLALGLRLAFFTGFVGSDDSVYLEAAADLAQRGHWAGQDLASSRLGFVAATAGAIKVFGLNEFGVVSISLLASLLTLVLVYLLARLYFDERAALLAVALLALYPLNIVFSTILVPEALLSCLMAAALLGYEAGTRAGSPGRIGASLGAGVLLGLAYLVKEPAALLLGALGLTWIATALRQRRIEGAWVAVVAGFVVTLGVEALLRYFTTGSAFERFRISSQTIAYGLTNWQEEREQSLWYLYPRSMFVSFYQVGLLFYLLAGTLVWAWVKSVRLPLPLLAWLVVVLGYLTFGGASFTSYAPLPKQPRYLEAITVPAILLIAGGLVRFVVGSRRFARPIAWLALTAYALSGVLCAEFTSVMERWRFEPIRVAYASLSQSELIPLYASPRVANGLYQLSGTRWYVLQSRSQACGENSKTFLIVWSARVSTGDRRPALPQADCRGWVLGQRLEIAQPAAVAGTLGIVQVLLDHAPAPEFLTAKIRRTLARDATTPVVTILVPAIHRRQSSASDSVAGGGAS